MNRVTITSSGERRRWVRYPADLGPFWVTMTGQNIRYSARVQDLSPGGVRLLINERVEPGTLLRIMMGTALEARLVHVTPTSDNSWTLGCEFVIALSEQNGPLTN